MTLKKNDIIIIAAVIVIAAVLLFLQNGSRLRTENSNISIVVTVNDSEVFRKKAAELKLPYRFTVDGYEGGNNEFLITEDEDGQIGIQCEKADCPDKICVQTGRVTLPDQPVVCLPHRITARISE